MKKIVLSALAVAAFAGAANADINFRIVAIEAPPIPSAGSQAAAGHAATGLNTFGADLFLNNRNTGQSIVTSQAGLRNALSGANVNTSGSTSIDTSGGAGQRIIFVLQAMWTGVAGGDGFATVGGNISTNEAAGSAMMARYQETAQNQEGIDFGEDPVSYVHGHFRPYNSLANLGDPNDPNANGDVSVQGGVWNVGNILGLQTGANPAGLAAGVWDNVFAWAYTNTDPTARTVMFNFADVAGYSSVFDGTANGQPNAVDSGEIGTASFTVNIVPAPGAAALLGLGGLLAARRRRA